MSGLGFMELATSYARNFFIVYRSPWKNMAKIYVDISTVDFVYFENVGLSSLL